MAKFWQTDTWRNFVFLPSCKKVRSFLTTGNSGMMGGCMLWLLRTLRYLAMFLDGSKTSWRSSNSFSYLLGNFSHELRSRATGAKFSPLFKRGKRGKADRRPRETDKWGRGGRWKEKNEGMMKERKKVQLLHRCYFSCLSTVSFLTFAIAIFIFRY